jgi:hypothetical protein
MNPTKLTRVTLKPLNKSTETPLDDVHPQKLMVKRTMNQTATRWPKPNEKLSEFQKKENRQKIESFFDKVQSDPVAFKLLVEMSEPSRRT